MSRAITIFLTKKLNSFYLKNQSFDKSWSYKTQVDFILTNFELKNQNFDEFGPEYWNSDIFFQNLDKSWCYKTQVDFILTNFELKNQNYDEFVLWKPKIWTNFDLNTEILTIFSKFGQILILQIPMDFFSDNDLSQFDHKQVVNRSRTL